MGHPDLHLYTNRQGRTGQLCAHWLGWQLEKRVSPQLLRPALPLSGAFESRGAAVAGSDIDRHPRRKLGGKHEQETCLVRLFPL